MCEGGEGVYSRDMGRGNSREGGGEEVEATETERARVLRRSVLASASGAAGVVASHGTPQVCGGR